MVGSMMLGFGIVMILMAYFGYQLGVQVQKERSEKIEDASDY